METIKVFQGAVTEHGRCNHCQNPHADKVWVIQLATLMFRLCSRCKTEMINRFPHSER